MGFGNGKYAVIWEVKQKCKSDGTPIPGWVDVKASFSSKKSDGTYEGDWNGFFTVSDSVNGNYATQLLALKPTPEHKYLAKVKLGDVEVKQRSYQKDGNWMQYTNYRVFGFQFVDENANRTRTQTQQTAARPHASGGFIDVPDSIIEEELPF